MTAVAEKKAKPASWERLRGLLGLATRAGQTVFGTEKCLAAARDGELALLLAERDVSPGTLEKLERACAAGGIPLVPVPPDTILLATGREGVAAGVRPGGLAESIERMSAELKNELQPEREIIGGGGCVE